MTLTTGNISITPFLWFNQEALAAAEFYTSLFPDSKIISKSPMVVTFEIAGQKVMALNGGPHFTLNEAFSFYVHCHNQEEVDHYWNALIEGGNESRCGWLKDKFGCSWQVIPSLLSTLLSDPDPKKSQRVMQAMLGMNKINCADLQKAYDQNDHH